MRLRLSARRVHSVLQRLLLCVSSSCVVCDRRWQQTARMLLLVTSLLLHQWVLQRVLLQWVLQQVLLQRVLQRLLLQLGLRRLLLLVMALLLRKWVVRCVFHRLLLLLVALLLWLPFTKLSHRSRIQVRKDAARRRVRVLCCRQRVGVICRYTMISPLGCRSHRCCV